jgi:hypothetical protein
MVLHRPVELAQIIGQVHQDFLGRCWDDQACPLCFAPTKKRGMGGQNLFLWQPMPPSTSVPICALLVNTSSYFGTYQKRAHVLRCVVKSRPPARSSASPLLTLPIREAFPQSRIPSPVFSAGCRLLPLSLHRLGPSFRLFSIVYRLFLQKQGGGTPTFRFLLRPPGRMSRSRPPSEWCTGD